jgi:HD-GYP domain-containing protein (c-di-GMP phosphodiesterase class II)
MAVVDVYDALVSERPYKKALSPEEAVNIIIENSGTHFDPLIVDALKSAKEKFEAIARL